MTYKEAADRIAEHANIHSAKEYPHAIKITEALNLAVTLLRKKAMASNEAKKTIKQVYGCTCAGRWSEEQLIKTHEVKNEEVPLHDFNDLTPSRFIEYETKRRFITKYSCPNCNKVLKVDKGILF